MTTTYTLTTDVEAIKLNAVIDIVLTDYLFYISPIELILKRLLEAVTGVGSS